VTFAALFASGVLGISVLGSFRHLLSRIGAPWYVWLILPIVLVTILARKEIEWLPDPEARRKWSRWLVFGSLVIALIVARLRPHHAPAAEPTLPERHDRAQVRGR
jgi:hypothetical protein